MLTALTPSFCHPNITAALQPALPAYHAAGNSLSHTEMSTLLLSPRVSHKPWPHTHFREEAEITRTTPLLFPAPISQSIPPVPVPTPHLPPVPREMHPCSFSKAKPFTLPGPRPPRPFQVFPSTIIPFCSCMINFSLNTGPLQRPTNTS